MLHILYKHALLHCYIYIHIYIYKYLSNKLYTLHTKPYISPSTSPVPGGLRLRPRGARGGLAAQAEPRGPVLDLAGGGTGAHAGGTGEATGDLEDSDDGYVHMLFTHIYIYMI